MSSLDSNFKELMERVRAGRDLGHAGVEPVYYLIFDPQEILQAKRMLPTWSARLRNDGWDVHRLSLAEAVTDILQSVAPARRKLWLDADRKDPLNWEKTNQSLAQPVTNGALLERVRSALSALQGRANAILLVTDLEALHPYTRIGTIEGQLVGKFCVPTVFFYPGKRAGKTKLKFLGFYPEDGNYRSHHVGD